jgi:hypothetical protein
MEGNSGCLGTVPDGEQGVGGWAGMKKEGIAATEAYKELVLREMLFARNTNNDSNI